MSEMSTVAEQLRAAREARNLTVEQVAEMTKIRTDHIRALEEGDFDVFSAPIYIRGSVKNYAATLKLDPVALLKTLDAELGRTEKYSEPPPLTDQKKTLVDHLTLLLAKLNWKKGFIGLIIVAAVVAGVIFFANWKKHPASDAVKDLPPAIAKPANTGETMPLRR
jgi:cytoskeletal protein RodZ